MASPPVISGKTPPPFGVNGGGYGGGGLLLDLGGNDEYSAESDGVNGGASGGPWAFGLLLDIGGRDTYRDSTTDCTDCTIVPKGSFGAQIDSDRIPQIGLCPFPPPSTFVLCITPENVVQTLAVRGTSDGTTHHVEAFVDAYRFRIPQGGSVILPCVTASADSTSSNPCALAGGEFVGRFLTLVSLERSEPTLGPPLLTVRVCEGRLTATVVGFGVEEIPALTLC